MLSGEQSDRITKLLNRGVRDGVYPGAVLLVAHVGETVFFQKAGHRSTPPAAPMTPDTVFDLASLTKPLATTMAIMKCVDDGKIDLDQSLGSLLPEPVGDKKDLTIRLILTHCAGFTDWEPFYLKLVESAPGLRKQLLRKMILEAPLAYGPREQTLYSDLGFMILEWVVEECTKMSLPDFLHANLYAPLTMNRTFFSGSAIPLPVEKDQIAATEDCPWRKKIIRGSVHDENAFAVGGYSGHSGLFGTAEDVYILLDLLMSHYHGNKNDYFKPETVRSFFTRQNLVKNSTWALGWDSPSPQNSSSGKYFSEKTVGHLGFTGTSIWMDLEQNVVVVFLTNRVHPSRKNEKIKDFRPEVHDLVMTEVL
jgi:CubicO group peptidase (beta-lactamase class C family)